VRDDEEGGERICFRLLPLFLPKISRFIVEKVRMH